MITGNLAVQGTTTTVKNTVIKDALIELNSGLVGPSANDSGIVIERGTTGDNIFMGWSEDNGKFIMGTTQGTGSSTGSLTVNVETVLVDVIGKHDGPFGTLFPDQGIFTTTHTLGDVF